MDDLLSRSNQLERQEMVEAYQKEIKKLLPFVPWLTEKRGQYLATTFQEEGIAESSVAFPVYDGTLLNFIKVLSATNIMNKNYLYDYRKYRIKEGEELDFIRRADLKHLPVICSFLSRYAMRGRTKGKVWAEGVLNGVYLESIIKIRDLVDKYDIRPKTGL